MDEEKLRALISLLDDSDPDVYTNISKELSKLSAINIPKLEDIWLESDNPVFQERLENIIDEIHHNSIIKELIKWKNSPGQDLIDGAILVNRSINYHVTTSNVKTTISKIVDEIKPQIKDLETYLEKIKILNHFLYYIHNFMVLSPKEETSWGGNIGTVLAQKKGNYIITSIIYAGIAQALKLPVTGIQLPNSILLSCESHETDPNSRKTKRNYFYINPIDNGAVLSAMQLELVIKFKKLSNLAQYYKPCNNLNLIRLLIQNQIFTYGRQNNYKYVEILKGLLNVLLPNIPKSEK
ncbi:transglutaminase superfamily protein [Ancylomarina subtilis]|uniref:Transglutaminase superfamily protein n=1 Tax=Ancylomarina subtilis TaxID=1639035 RepID=A0A4V2FSU9_9BACT|nr:transglutaminase family protein [Ancylomarina subtilis]RZT95655.1 transglutaminase superfamily protein [Ancylomarina subtilis]